MVNKKIVILTGHFYPDNSADSYLLTELAEDLVLEGFDVGVLTRKPSYYININAPLNELYKGVVIERINSIRLNRQNLLLRVFDNLLFSFGLFVKSFKNRDGLVLVNTMPFMMPFVLYVLNKIYGQNYVLINYEVLPELAGETGVVKKEGVFYSLYNFAMKKVLKRASKVIVIGNDMKEVISKKVCSDKIEVIPNWADSKKFFPKEGSNFRAENGLSGRFVVQYSGNIGRMVDFEPILDVAKKMSDDDSTRFVFIGEGIKKKALEKRVKLEGLDNVLILPYQERDCLRESLNSCDVSIVITKKGCEGFVVPSKLYPLMACGNPIVGLMSKNSEAADTIKSANCGYVVDNSEELFNVLTVLKKNKKKRGLLGKNARSFFLNNFDRKIVTRKYINLLKELL